MIPKDDEDRASPRLLPPPPGLAITQRDDLDLALDDAERMVEPPTPIRVRWSGDWYEPALLRAWQHDETRGGWLGCVEYYREYAPGFGYAVGRWTPAHNIEQVS